STRHQSSIRICVAVRTSFARAESTRTVQTLRFTTAKVETAANMHMVNCASRPNWTAVVARLRNEMWSNIATANAAGRHRGTHSAVAMNVSASSASADTPTIAATLVSAA